MPLRVLAICALVFCAELGQAMLAPLLPEIGRAFALGTAETGLVLSLATFATLAAAVPAGLLAERIGALRVSVAAGALIAASAAVQAVATDFPTFLCGRALFGVGFAAIWTAGAAVATGPDSPRSAVAATMAAGGLAHVVGPPLSGVLSDAVARSLPFWLLAAGAAAVTLLAAGAPGGASPPAPALGLRAVARAARREPALRSATVLIALIGVLTALVPLVVPLLLDRAGFSSGEIGGVFAAASVAWVTTSTLAVRAGARAVTIGVAAGGLALLAVASLMPVITLATPCLVAFAIVRASLQAPLSTITYDLGAQGARSAGVAVGTAMGMLNLVWAAGATVAPLVGGAVLAGAGARWVFVLLALACAVAGWSMRRDAVAGRRALARRFTRRKLAVH
jgi:predicted MFS family arabinose efflux permease